MTVVETNTRISALRKLLSEAGLSTQDELRAELERLKFKVTQSTISRDLRRLGAVKALDANGRTVYRMVEEAMPPTTSARLDELVTEIRSNGSIIVLITSPGSASLVARHLDHFRPGDILGTIAGDDTIFVAPPSLKNIRVTIEEIRNSLQSNRI
ncbi:MAG: arginine repressor [Bdellovibrionales bacterium]